MYTEVFELIFVVFFFFYGRFTTEARRKALRNFLYLQLKRDRNIYIYIYKWSLKGKDLC